MKTYKKRHNKKTNKTLSQKGGNKELIDMLHTYFTRGALEVAKLDDHINREKTITNIKHYADGIARLVKELNIQNWR